MFTVEDVSLLLGAAPHKRERVVSEQRPVLGFYAVDGSSPARVSAVIPGSPEERAGLRAGDTISAIDGQAVSSSEDAMSSLARLLPGTVTMTTSRGDVSVTSVELPVEQCYWEVEAGPVARSVSSAYVGTYGGSAVGASAAYSRFFRATCRFWGGVLSGANWNYQE